MNKTVTHNRPQKKSYRFLCLLLLPSTVTAGLNTGIDAEAQLPYWEYSDTAMAVRLVQRLPIQTRGYFQARGFSKMQAERIAQSCVFQTVFKNTSHLTSPTPLRYNLRDWRVHTPTKLQGLKTREDWAKEWLAEGVKQSAQVAFEWSLYPTAQEYKAGDYNWGMTIFDLKPGSTFDLELYWQQYGKTRHTTIRNIQCAPDINPQPAENP